MFCCGNCFDDSFLADQIKDMSVSQGQCDYCLTLDVDLLEPSKLQDLIQPVLDLYAPSAESERNLVQNLKCDWALFGSLEDDKCFSLLEVIFPGEIQEGSKYELIKRLEVDEDEAITQWDLFKDELKYKNRYFPEQKPNYEQLKELFGYLEIVIQPRVDFFRSRIEKGEGIIELAKMGAPPSELAQAGRANPIGIPYLYVASDPETAIAECRPHKGDNVSVATFQARESLTFVDLRNPRRSISPFSVEDSFLSKLFADIGYLCRLGEELSKAILPRNAQLEYLPSQLLCELIKNSGFDGVIYKSSVGSGDNYAIYLEDKVAGSLVHSYQVTDTRISTSLHT